jgi:hypothetical protein
MHRLLSSSTQEDTTTLPGPIGPGVEAEVVCALRRPEEATSVEALVGASALLLRLEAAFVQRIAQRGRGGEGERVAGMLVRRDVEGRLRALGAIGVANFGPAAIAILMTLSARSKAAR